MKKIKLLSLLLIITLFAGILSVPVLAVDDPVTAAQSVVLMDTDSGEILYQKGGDIVFDPNALNMLMAALVTGDSLGRQDIRLDDVVTVPDTVYYNMPDGTGNPIGLIPGETLTVEQLLYAAVLVSSNDSANALAQYVYGSYDAFVTAMNSKAQELGCINTFFANVGGMYHESQVTTALDLAKIARAVFQNEQVGGIFKAESYTIPATALAGERPLVSPNALISSSDERRYELAYACKYAASGYGTHVAAAATYNGMDVTAVVAGCPEGTDPFVETRNLFDWVFANFGYHTLVGSTDILATLPVSMGNPDSVGVRASDNIQMLMANDQDVSDMTLDIVYAHEQEGTQLQAPIEVGEYLGDLTVTVGGQVRGTSRLVAATAVDISRLNYLRSQLDVLLQNPSVRQTITILLAALGVYLLLVVIYVIQRIVHLHSLRRTRKARARTRAQEELGWLELPQEEEDAGYLPESGLSGPVQFREEPAEEDDLPEEDEAPEDEAPVEEEFVEEEAPVEEDEAPQDEAPAEEGFVEEAPAEEEEYYEDDGEYYEDEDYEDEDGGEPQGKHHWWKRK